jgi:hypothetical protein
MKPQISTSPTETKATEFLLDHQEQISRRAFELFELRGNAMPPNILRYKSGEEIRTGDRVLLNGNRAKIEAWFCDARNLWRGAVVVWDLVTSARTVIPRALLDKHEDLRFESRSECKCHQR